jgi:ribonuclease VapC
MVIDTSALIAYLEQEPGADRIEQKLLEADRLSISTATIVECGIVIEARRGDAGGRELDLLLHRLGVEVVAVDEAQAELARSAYRRFGKGRHPAALNFGDCFSYALAQSIDQELLYIGHDFDSTDVRSAL